MARTMLLGLAIAVAVSGVAAGKPPGLPLDPQVEGREPNPVAQQFHEPDVVVAGHAWTATMPARTDSERIPNTGRLAVLFRLGDELLDGFTFPLGTVQMWD